MVDDHNLKYILFGRVETLYYAVLSGCWVNMYECPIRALVPALGIVRFRCCIEPSCVSVVSWSVRFIIHFIALRSGVVQS